MAIKYLKREILIYFVLNVVEMNEIDVLYIRGCMTRGYKNSNKKDIS
jgi:hypothetical protein